MHERILWHKKTLYVGSTKDLHNRHANHKKHANNHRIGSKFQCKLTEHLILEHGGFVEPEFLKFMAIDTIENMPIPNNVTNVEQWRIGKLEELEEEYRTKLCSYRPLGLQCKKQRHGYDINNNVNSP